MVADQVEVSWDANKSKWMVRIQSGEEVIRRHCDLPKDAGEETLRQAAEKTLRDEGYQADGAAISVQRLAA
jgi:hypothetical protein